MVIGGDGTIISTIRKLLILEIPFLGINIGKLGFLTDINLESISEELPKIFNAEYVREKRPLLEVLLSKNEKKIAVNEVVFHSGKVAQMMSFSIYLGNNLPLITLGSCFKTSIALVLNGIILSSPFLV